MLQRLRKARNSDDGFTLTELLITIIILGVLAGIVVFAVSQFADDGKSAACKADKKTIEIAAEAYFAQKKVYPPGANSAARIATLQTAGYIKQTPPTVDYLIDLDAVGVVTVGVGSSGKPVPAGC